MNRNTQRRKEHRDGFEAFCAEARNARNEGMTVNLIIVRPRETLDLVMASAAGDRQAMMILRGVGSVLARIADKSRETMLCATCDREILSNKPPGPIALQLSWGHEHRDAPQVIASACCDAGGELSTAELTQRLMTMVRKSYLPDAKIITPSAEAGTA
jgi:hypothetical protein